METQFSEVSWRIHVCTHAMVYTQGLFILYVSAINFTFLKRYEDKK